MDWQKAAEMKDLAVGVVKQAEISGRKIDLAKVGEDVFAFDDSCTHKQCSLSEGLLEGVAIECPCHGGKFDVISGAVLALPPIAPLKTYPVKVEDGAIFVVI